MLQGPFKQKNYVLLFADELFGADEQVLWNLRKCWRLCGEFMRTKKSLLAEYIVAASIHYDMLREIECREQSEMRSECFQISREGGDFERRSFSLQLKGISYAY